MTRSEQLAAAAATAASSKQARDVVVLDMRDVTTITDHFVIASGTSDRQVRTIAEEIENALRAEGLKPVRREGVEDARWILLDFVDLVAHVFQQDEREYYSLERLWGDAPRLAWEPPAASSG